MLLQLIRKTVDSLVRRGRTFTPPISSPNGIAALEQTELNGQPQWLLLRGEDVSRPVLLFVHGGPGFAEMWLAHHTMRELEKHFVCVNWDQAGAGKSFSPTPRPETMTIGRFVEDTIALIETLRRRFGQRKVLLVGHSWGSMLAMKVAARRPDLLHAVVGVAQVVHMQRNEASSYRYVLEKARADRIRRAIRALERIGPPPYRKGDVFVQRRWLSRYRGDTWSIDVPGVLSIGLGATEYSIGDFVGFLKGARYTNLAVWDELMAVDLLREIPALSVPVAFLLGRHDRTAWFELAEELHASLRAPSKEIVWFEDSAHMPNVEEPEKFQRTLIELGRRFCSG